MTKQTTIVVIGSLRVKVKETSAGRNFSGDEIRLTCFFLAVFFFFFFFFFGHW